MAYEEVSQVATARLSIPLAINAPRGVEFELVSRLVRSTMAHSVLVGRQRLATSSRSTETIETLTAAAADLTIDWRSA